MPEMPAPTAVPPRSAPPTAPPPTAPPGANPLQQHSPESCAHWNCCAHGTRTMVCKNPKCTAYVMKRPDGNDTRLAIKICEGHRHACPQCWRDELKPVEDVTQHYVDQMDVDDKEPYAPIVDLSFIGEEGGPAPPVSRMSGGSAERGDEDVAFSDISSPSPQHAEAKTAISPTRTNLNNKYVVLTSPLLPDPDGKWSNTPPGRAQPNWTPGSTNITAQTNTPPREFKYNPWADLDQPVVQSNPNPGDKIDPLGTLTTSTAPISALGNGTVNINDRWLSEPHKSAEFYPANYGKKPDPISIADWSASAAPPNPAAGGASAAQQQQQQQPIIANQTSASAVIQDAHGHPQQHGMPPPLPNPGQGYQQFDPNFANPQAGPMQGAPQDFHGHQHHAHQHQHQHQHQHGHFHGHQHQHQHMQHQHIQLQQSHSFSRLNPNSPPFQSGKGQWNPQSSAIHPPPPPTGWAPQAPPGWSEIGAHKFVAGVPGMHFAPGTKNPELAALGDNQQDETKTKEMRLQRKRLASQYLSQALGRLTCPADREIKIEDFICAFVDVHAIVIEDPPERISPGFSCCFDFGAAFVRKGALEGANNARCRATVIALPVGTRGSLLAQSGNRSLFKSLGNGSHDFHRYRRTYGFGANCHVCLSTREFASYHGWYWAICSSPNRNVSWSIAASLMTMVSPRKFTGQFLWDCCQNDPEFARQISIQSMTELELF